MRQIVTILSGLIFAATSVAQGPPSIGPKLSSIKSIVRERGWEIPGLSQSRITDPRKLSPPGYGVTGVPLNITILKPRRVVVTTISLFGLKPDGTTLVMNERRGAVQIIIKCDVNHHVFAYIVQFMALVQDSNGRVGYSGIYGAQYFDNNGDGIFESYEPGPPFVTHDLRIPNWVWPPT